MTSSGDLQDHITIESSLGMTETIRCLRLALERRGMTLYAYVDHSREAELARISLRPTHLFLAGYAPAESPLIARHQLLGLDLPLRFLVRKDETQRVSVTCSDLLPNVPPFIRRVHSG